MSKKLYVEGIDFDKIDEVNRIAETLVHEWGIDEDVATDIVAAEFHNMMDQYMLILSDGTVVPANDEADLKQCILDYLQDESGSLTDIEYIFVKGEKMDMGLDVQFTKQDNSIEFNPTELEKQLKVPEPPTTDEELYHNMGYGF